MIRIGLRKNLFYLLMLTIFNFLRNIDTIVMNQIIGLNGSLFLTFLMFLGEFIAGLIIYIRQIRFLRSRRTINIFMGIKLIQASSEISTSDNKLKIYFLIFIISYFDFIEFMMATLYIPQIKNVSGSLAKRLNGILTISAALLCYHFLKLPLFKHHKFSLIIVFVCFLIVLFFEFFFKIIYEQSNLMYLTFVIALIFVNHFFTAFKDVIEKYLMEIDYINPFKLLMIEGIFGCILTSIYSIKEESFSKIISIYDEHNYKFILLIVCFFLFFFFSGGRNAYRIITNKIYSPMTRTLTDCALDPLLITYYFIIEKDFSINNEQNIIYFIINLIISIIIVFFGCVYNEIFILFCYDLEHNTHYYVSIRASSVDNSHMNLNISKDIKINETNLKNIKTKEEKSEENNSDENNSEENNSEDNNSGENNSGENNPEGKKSDIVEEDSPDNND